MQITPFLNLKTIFFNKRFVLVFLLAVAFFSILPSTASAFWGIPCPVPGICDTLETLGNAPAELRELGNIILGLPVSIPVFIIVTPLLLFTALMGVISALLSSMMLKFVQSTMQIGVTPANQDIVKIGFDISLNLANMILLLIFVFIGLATILRLQSYEMKKMLPRVLLIALLVNFSGVLVGFIVDIGNLITNFFLSKGVGFGAMIKTILDIFKDVGNLFKVGLPNVFPESISLLGNIIVSLIYYILVALIMFIIMFLFFVRIIILWVLAMLAPLAFVAYILPATKKLWDQWWQNLIQWSIIGIPISFFLFISSHILQNSRDIGKGFALDYSAASPNALLDSVFKIITELIVAFMGNFVVLAMLIVGVMLSMSMAPAGAKAIMSYAKKGAGMLAKTRGGQLLLGKAAGLVEKPLGKALAIMSRMEGYIGDKAGGVPLVGRALKPLATSGLRPLGWAGRDISSRLLRFQEEALDPNIPKEFDKMSASRQEEFMNLQPYSGDRLKYMDRAMSSGTFRFFSDEGKKTIADDVFEHRTNSQYAREVGRWKESAIGDLTAQMMIDSAAMDKEGPEAEAARKNMRQKIGMMEDYIGETLTDDEIMLELGIKEGYIGRDKIKTTEGKNQALGIIRQKLGREEEQRVAIEEFISNTAAGAVQTEGLDVKDIDRKTTLPSTLTSLAFRMGSHNFAPAHMRKITDSFESGVVTAILDEPGGLNAIFKNKSPEEGKKLLKRFVIDPEHRRLVSWFISSPVGQAMGFEGLKFMRDVNGNRTNNLADFEQDLRMNDLFTNIKPLKEYHEKRIIEDGLKKELRAITREIRQNLDARTTFNERNALSLRTVQINAQIAKNRTTIDKLEADSEDKDELIAGFDEIQSIKEAARKNGGTRRKDSTEEEEETGEEI